MHPRKDDPHALDRFLAAQEDIYATALAELRQGRKQSHWMWFIFPQLRGLGRSEMSHFFGLADLAEAQAYVEHPVLGPRLLAAADAVLLHQGVPATRIMGEIDAAKLRSSATLFAATRDAPASFSEILDQFYEGRPCRRTLSLLEA